MTRKDRQQQTIKKKKTQERIKKQREKRYGAMDAWMDSVYSIIYGQTVA